MARQHKPLTVWTIGLMGVQPDDRILDIGCGGGMAVSLLSQVAREGFVTGLDYSPEMVRQATRRNRGAVERGRVELRQGDAMALPFAEGSFDKVCGIETFYFWPDPLQGLREAYRVLKVGGELAITLEMSKEAAAPTSRIRKYLSRRFVERSAAARAPDLLRGRAGGHDPSGGVPRRSLRDGAEPVPRLALCRSPGSDRGRFAG